MGGISNPTEQTNKTLFKLLLKSQIVPKVVPGNTKVTTYRLYNLICVWEPAANDRVWCEYYDKPKSLPNAKKFFDDGDRGTFSGKLLGILKSLPTRQGTSGASTEILTCEEHTYSDGSKWTQCDISVPIEEDKEIIMDRI